MGSRAPARSVLGSRTYSDPAVFIPWSPGIRRTRRRRLTAVDLAPVVDVLPDKNNAAKDLGVLNIRQRAAQLHRTDDRTVILVFGGAYGVLSTVAGIRAILAGAAILPVKRVR